MILFPPSVTQRIGEIGKKIARLGHEVLIGNGGDDVHLNQIMDGLMKEVTCLRFSAILMS